MKRQLLKSKIHRATVTETDMNYEGSISIGPELLKAADVVEYEKVDVYDITNGAWFSTYVTEARPGEICINGATARLVETGDLIIIASYSNYDETESDDHQARLIAVDEHNRILRQHSKEPGR